jgi:hypothetical protein
MGNGQILLKSNQHPLEHPLTQGFSNFFCIATLSKHYQISATLESLKNYNGYNRGRF